MLALSVPDLPAGEWIYEIKFDGYRTLAFKMDKEVRLLSRNRTLFNDNYPQLVDALKSLKARSFIIDGEIAALDEKGRSSFQLLQSYGVAKGIPLVYYVFDLLSLEGTDLRSRLLVEARRRRPRPGRTRVPFAFPLRPVHRRRHWWYGQERPHVEVVQ